VILVSACLAGIPCRWNGEARADEAVVELVRAGKAIPVCPEQLGGLPTPRSPSEIRGGRVLSKEGLDLTERFERGARIVLEIGERYGCSEAILKARSPSCGSGRVYDGSFSGALAEGDGLTAALLRKRGYAIYSEEEAR